MSSNTISLLLPLFKGNSLESEFGFVNYYHSHPMNRLLHTLGVPLLIFGILTITYSIDYRLALFFYIFYCAIIFLFDYKTAISFIILFGILFSSIIIFSFQGRKSIFYGLILFFTSLIMQGFGHYKFEQSSPAFHPFQTLFTTPVFLMMYLITDHNKPFWNNVKKETNKWKQILNK